MTELYDTTTEVIEHNPNKVFMIDYNPKYYPLKSPGPIGYAGIVKLLTDTLNQGASEVNRVILNLDKMDLCDFTRLDEGSIIISRTFDREYEVKPQYKYFIFYTNEGITQDDFGSDINNTQILDYQTAEDLPTAIEQFKSEINLSEYSFDDVFIIETKTKFDDCSMLSLKSDEEDMEKGGNPIV